MPSSPDYIRDYKQEGKYHSTPSQKEKRASRGRARYSLAKKGKVRVGDGLDVDHKDTNPNNNSPSNLRVQPKGDNRSFKRDKKGGKKNV